MSHSSLAIYVYTAVYGGYDVIKPPELTPRPTQYWYWYCLTDSATSPPQPYQSRTVPCDLSPRRCARRCKILSHRMFPDAQFTIWHGGNVQLRGDISALLNLVSATDVAVLEHSERNCAYHEAVACIDWRLDDTAVIKRQMTRYRDEGFPNHYGLSAAFLIVRRHTLAIQELNDLWWHEVSTGSVRDQLSFDYCCWKLGIRPAIIPGDIFTGPYHKRFPIHKR